MNRKKSSTSALDELKRAVGCLQKFVSEKREERALLELKGGVRTALPFNVGPIAKLVAQYVAAKISDKRLKGDIERRAKERRELVGAIDVIKIHHRLIAKLERGSDEEAGFAHLIHSAIEDYNGLVQEAAKPPKGLGERIRRYFDPVAERTSRLSLPTPARLSMTNSSKTYASALDTFERLPHPPRSEEIDLFRMKVIRKIQEKKLLPIGETLREVRSCPIDAVTTTAVHKDGMTSGTIVTLRQTCIPLPGEKLDFIAPYERDDNNHGRGVPIGDITYRLTSSQTGFPDPGLTAGIGLPEHFIPTMPLRPEMAPTLELLLERRREVAYALLPQGALNQKAKQLYSLHKQLYDQDPSYFITKHRKVLEKLLPLLGASLEEQERVNRVLSARIESPTSFEELSTPYRLLGSHLEGAFEQLEGTFFCYEGSESSASSDEMRAKLKESLIEAIQENQEESDPFAEMVERHFYDCSCSFILQAYSEKYNFAPPELSEEELRLQSIVFFQQLYFFQQLEKPQELLSVQELVTSLHFYFDNLLGLLQGKAPSPLAQLAQFLVEEVTGYYKSRYFESVNSSISLSVSAR